MMNSFDSSRNTMSILDLQPVADFLQRHSNHSSQARPTAVFDCDGTVVKGDVGEAMLFYQIEHFLFKVSPASVWPDHPERSMLDGLYRQLAAAEPAARCAHTAFHSFVDIILSWYFGQINDGKVEKACADIVRLFAGYTLAEVRSIADRVFKEETSSPLTTRKFGSRTVSKGVRYIQESLDLIRELQRLRFTIWAVSGSNKWSVEPVFRQLGIGEDFVIGIDLEEENGVLTPRAKTPIPIRENKVHAFQKQTASLPVLVASDSRNDIPLFLYSTELKVRINSRGRDTEEFFREGKITRDDQWVVIEQPKIEEHIPLWQMQQLPS
jgi:phosphoserine phosphatase